MLPPRCTTCAHRRDRTLRIARLYHGSPWTAWASEMECLSNSLPLLVNFLWGNSRSFMVFSLMVDAQIILKPLLCGLPFAVLTGFQTQVWEGPCVASSAIVRLEPHHQANTKMSLAYWLTRLPSGMWTNFGNVYQRWPIGNPSIGIQTNPKQFCHFRTFLVCNYIILTPRKRIQIQIHWHPQLCLRTKNSGCHAKTAFLVQQCWCHSARFMMVHVSCATQVQYTTLRTRHCRHGIFPVGLGPRVLASCWSVNPLPAKRNFTNSSMQKTPEKMVSDPLAVHSRGFAIGMASVGCHKPRGDFAGFPSNSMCEIWLRSVASSG